MSAVLAPLLVVTVARGPVWAEAPVEAREGPAPSSSGAPPIGSSAAAAPPIGSATASSVAAPPVGAASSTAGVAPPSATPASGAGPAASAALPTGQIADQGPVQGQVPVAAEPKIPWFYIAGGVALFVGAAVTAYILMRPGSEPADPVGDVGTTHQPLVVHF
jgi:hypothetical protein